MPVSGTPRGGAAAILLACLLAGVTACSLPGDGPAGPTATGSPPAPASAPDGGPTSIGGSPTALPSPFDTATWTTAVPYGPDDAQVLDVYVPDDEVPSPTGDPDQRPAIVLVHGGGWTGGDRVSHHVTGAGMATLGWVGVSVGYRLAPDHQDPAAQDDVRAALQHLHGLADELGVDPDRVVLAGDSAGGHLSGMVALSDDRPPVAAWVAWSGIYDMARLPDRLSPEHAWLAAHVGEYLGCDDPAAGTCRGRARAASPVTHASADDPPTILLHSTDELVPLEDAQAMRDALDQAGVQVSLETFEGSTHGGHLVPAAADAVSAFLTDVLDLTP